MTIVAHTEPLDIDIYARDAYYFQYKSQAFRDLIADIGKTVDDKARLAKYAEAEKMLAQEVPALFLFQLPKLGVWNVKLKGMWENTPIPSNDVTEVYWAE
jgi:peptide/nickel transport system substrate-binding protein